MRVRRLVWRHLPRGAEPLHLHWILTSRGRWNTQRPRFPCLYTAYHREGAVAEFGKLAAGDPVFARQPRDLVSLWVDVEPVLDLLDPDVQRAYGISIGQMQESGRRTYATCRRVARRAILRDGYRGIRAPSAAGLHQGGKILINLMIYPASTHGRLLTQNGPDRLPLNYGSAPWWP